jgi:hypothetical protein
MAIAAQSLVYSFVWWMPLTSHRAFDAGLIYLDEEFRMRLSEGKIQVLEPSKFVGGLEAFKAPLGQIFLPPDSA